MPFAVGCRNDLLVAALWFAGALLSSVTLFRAGRAIHASQRQIDTLSAADASRLSQELQDSRQELANIRKQMTAQNAEQLRAKDELIGCLGRVHSIEHSHILSEKDLALKVMSASSAAEQLHCDCNAQAAALISDNGVGASDGLHDKYRAAEAGVIYVMGIHGAAKASVKQYEARYNEAGGKVQFYSREILHSLETLRYHSPNVRVALITDEPNLPTNISSLFDDVVLFNPDEVNAPWGEKIIGMMKSPYKRTLYLDGDTMICDDITHMFAYLDHYDLAAVLEPPTLDRFAQSDFEYSLSYLTHHNAGVMLLKATSRTRAFLSNLRRIHTHGSDQWWMAKRGLAEQSDVRHLVLPVEYNLRIWATSAPILIRGKVKIVHQRQAYESWWGQRFSCAAVNGIASPRLWDPYNAAIFTWWVDEEGMIKTAAVADELRRKVTGRKTVATERYYDGFLSRNITVQPLPDKPFGRWNIDDN
mmetsp:Transcript_326/g.1094  ORF Transcript_326/g.1094 Transcript_326/m.1094 type:complete len:475 (-) Transcript_326:431-1855(-)